LPKLNAARSFRKTFSVAKIKNIYDIKILGAKTIGLDRVDSKNFEARNAEEIALISRKVLAGNYRFTKYKEKLISKGLGKSPRQLSIPTIRDRLTLKLLCEYLFEVFPGSKPSLPQDKIDKLRKSVDEGLYTHFIKIDLKDFYPSISHKLLISKLRKRVRLDIFKTLIVSALENPTTSDANIKNVSNVKQGVAQGLSISNVLAEIFMLDVDSRIREVTPVFFRFVDDLIVLTDSDPSGAFEKINSILRKSKLNPHPIDAIGSKTKIGKISDGLEFLGYSIKPKKVSVRKSSVINFEGSLVDAFSDYKHRLRDAKNVTEQQTALARFRWNLNLKITGCIYKNQRFGWMFYYSQINDLSILKRIDNTIGMLFSRFKIARPPNPKRLLKTYYESKRTDKESHWYIPNYDSLSIEKKKRFLTEIGQKIDNLPDNEVDFVFHRLIRRATRSLEKDVLSFS
jgi:RNA-directed DNA polymerase